MTWNVYYYNPNIDKVEIKNLFNMGITFNKDFEVLRKQVLKGDIATKEEFAEKLNSIIQYTYWARREYEIAISDLCWTYSDATDEMKLRWYKQYCKTAVKVDIYSQIKMNWDIFVDYVWNEVKRND